MENKINKFLNEQMGFLWHDIEFEDEGWICTTCKVDGHNTDYEFMFHRNINFNTENGFFKLWNWAIKQDWFGEVALALNHHLKFFGSYHEDSMKDIGTYYINPDRFSKAIYKYLSGEEINE
jgi:hypothetical protein